MTWEIIKIHFLHAFLLENTAFRLTYFVIFFSPVSHKDMFVCMNVEFYYVLLPNNINY